MPRFWRWWLCIYQNVGFNVKCTTLHANKHRENARSVRYVGQCWNQHQWPAVCRFSHMIRELRVVLVALEGTMYKKDPLSKSLCKVGIVVLKYCPTGLYFLLVSKSMRVCLYRKHSICSNYYTWWELQIITQTCLWMQPHCVRIPIRFIHSRISFFHSHWIRTLPLRYHITKWRIKANPIGLLFSIYWNIFFNQYLT